MFQVDYGMRTEFPLIEEGEHDAIIHSLTLDNGPKGSYLKTRFSLSGDALNRQAWLNLSLADGALWKVTKMARDLGVADATKKYKSRTEFEQDVIAMFTGRPCTIVIEHEEFDGVIRNRVTSVGAPAVDVVALASA